MKITLIVGLPGSGKTHYARLIANGRNIVDDPKSLADFENQTNDFIICDPYLCSPFREGIIESILLEFYPKANIEWIYFDNDPEQCLINSRTRLDKKVDNFILQLSKKYVIPQDANVLPVWKD